MDLSKAAMNHPRVAWDLALKQSAACSSMAVLVIRPILAFVILVMALIGTVEGAPNLPKASPVPISDYVQYWAASRVNLAGGNPYDWHELLAVERQVEPSLPTPVIMWNPPWTLSLSALPSLLPYSLSRALWLIASGLALAVSAGLLWRYWGGTSRQVMSVVFLALVFPSSVFALVMGQISPLLLLGTAGFLYFERQGRLGAAGAAAAVTLIKPQVVYLLWAGLAVWAHHGRRWRFFAGVAIALVAMSAVPLAMNPSVFLDYLQALRGHPPNYFVTPTLGTVLRLLAGWEHTWLMFVPATFGIVWLTAHWRTHARHWRWSSQVSTILLLSVVTSPYAWLFDQVLLLVPVLQLMAAHGRQPSLATRWALALHGLAAAAAFVILPWNVNVHHPADASSDLLVEAFTTPNMFWHITIAPLFLIGFLIFKRRSIAVA